MRNFWIFFFFLISCMPVWTQISVSGFILSQAGDTLSFAIITLHDMHTDNILKYTTSDIDGKFDFKDMRMGNYTIKVKHLGYKNYASRFSVSGDNKNIEQNIFLEEDNTLQEIVVKSKRTGVRMLNDTIRYDPKVFTDGSERVLGNVLNKLPGITVDESGNIQAQGKTVDKLLLNGQYFFAGNTQLATKNFSADIADKVEVLNNYSEFSLLKGFQSHEKTVINVGVSKNKFGKLSGDLNLGGGFENKYVGKTNLILIKPKLMASFIGASNNNGEQTLSFEEYIRMQGGFNEALGGSTNVGLNTIRLSQEESNMLRPENNIFKRSNSLAALNVVYRPTSKFKVNSYLLYNYDRKEMEDRMNSKYILPSEEGFATEKELTGKDRHHLYSAYVKADYRPSKTDHLTYKGVATFTKSLKTMSIAETFDRSNFNTDVENRGNMRNFSHRVSYLKGIGKHVLTTSLSFSDKAVPSVYSLSTDSLLLPLSVKAENDRYQVQQQTKQKQRNGMADVGFMYYLDKNYYINSGFDVGFDRQDFKSNIISLQSDEKDFRNNFHAGMNHYSYYASLNKRRGFVRFRAGGVLNFYTFENSSSLHHIKNKGIWRLSPDVELSLHFSSQHSLSANYSRIYSLIDVSKIAQGFVLSDYQSYSKQSLINQLYSPKDMVGLRYSYMNFFSDISIIAMGMYEKQHNPKSFSFRQEGVVTVSQAKFSPTTNAFSSNILIEKGLNIIPWKLSLYSDFTRSNFYNYPDLEENRIKNDEWDNGLKIFSRLKGFFNFEVNTKLKFYKNRSSLGAKNHQSIQQYGGEIKFFNKKKIKASIGGDYVMNKTSLSNKKFLNMGFLFSYALDKHLTLELEGKNILHIKNHSWTEISYNGIYF